MTSSNSESAKNTRTSWRIATYATFSFLHLLIIGKNFELLQYIFENQREVLMKELLKEVKVQDPKPKMVIEQDKWKDMEASEDVIRREGFIQSRTVIVRPTNMNPVNANKAFTEKWRKQGGENVNYLVKMADESPPNMWINRRTVATFLLDCIDDHQYDGKAVSLFQGEKTKLNQIEPTRRYNHRT